MEPGVGKTHLLGIKIESKSVLIDVILLDGRPEYTLSEVRTLF